MGAHQKNMLKDQSQTIKYIAKGTIKHIKYFPYTNLILL